MNNDKKRELIKNINSDSSLSEKEKNIQIQKLMLSNYLSQQIKSNELKKCEHYEKLCYNFKFSCCNIQDPCKRCHLERNSCNLENIKVINITCSECNISQEPNDFCVNCKIKFSNSHCDICKIWTQKQITHCDKCKICRIGLSDTLFHCDDCGICFNKVNNQNNSHKCSKKSISSYKEGICVICSDNTFDSQIESFPLICGHFIHQNCFTQYISNNNFKCPYCKKSICNLKSQWDFIRYQIKLHPLPNDIFTIELQDIVDTKYGKFKILETKFSENNKLLYVGEFIEWKYSNDKKNIKGILNSESVKKNLYKNIHCNDCEKKSSCLFHFYGLECAKCGSFNTQE
jgi:RING finger/CHY zinc finger protein 1